MRLFPLRSLSCALIAAFLLCACSDKDNPTDTGSMAPQILSFTGTPSSVEEGTSVKLQWSVNDDQASLMIDQGIGSVTGKTSMSVSPFQNTTYTLTARNSFGTTTKSITITISNPSDPGAPPVPVDFIALTGGSGVIQLTWSPSPGAVSYIIERRSEHTAYSVIGSTPANMFMDADLFPGSSYFYRVRAVGASGARSGYSTRSGATVDGTAPVIGSIAIEPEASQTVKPGETRRFTATAKDKDGNVLPFSQAAFSWRSSAPHLASIDATGLMTAGSAQGVTFIRARLGNGASPRVPVTLSNRVNKILAIFQPKTDPNEDFTACRAGLEHYQYDELMDAINLEEPNFSFELIKDYETVIFFSHLGYLLSQDRQIIFSEYLNQGNKRLVIFGPSNKFNKSSLSEQFGVARDYGWLRISDIQPTLTGAAGSALAGLSFSIADSIGSVGNLTLTGNGTVAMTGTERKSKKQFIVAVQNTTGPSKTFYGSFIFEAVEPAKRQEIIARILGF